MKKIAVTMLGLLLLSSTAFAAGPDVTATDGVLAIGGTNLASGAGASEDLSIGLSPRVVARYVTDGVSETTAQWYAIASVHPGGNVGYATAQDVNNIYMKAFVTGDVTTTITESIQTEKAPAAAAEGATAEEIAAAAALTWTGNDWSTTAP